ncbi:GNAT family N-acetyltransferase [Acidobacteriota bacterium]
MPCGYAAISQEDDGIHVREFAVHPDSQGKKVGKLLYPFYFKPE